jgi:murein L,D-transpeptidase YafK
VLVGAILLLALFLGKNFLVREGKNTIESIVAKYGEAAHARLKEKFDKAGLPYPPKSLTLVGLKAEKSLEIYCGDSPASLHYLCTYPILGTSGVLGPKLREGDKQMPEGFYRIQELEPNSSYHVALRVNYPGDFDREKGKLDGREKLGCDIMIHGKDCSIGCLAMGDPASEDLFVLVNDVGIANTELVMSPYDFRKPPQGVSLPNTPTWVRTLYADLQKKISGLPVHS